MVKGEIKSVEQHTGDLGHNATVWFDYVPYSWGNGTTSSLEEVAISDKTWCVHLTPSEALSLLRWLSENKPQLEELMKANGEDVEGWSC
jgi:hypothetical protein